MGKLVDLNKLFSLKLSIDTAYPSIWRRVLVHKVITLHHLHRIIQIVFGWSANHEHTFEFTDHHIDTCEDELQLPLNDLFLKHCTDFYYFYGSGQGWGVRIEVESEAQIEFGTHYPYCTGGELPVPNEKCGSIHGYYAIISVLNNPNHPKYIDFIDSFGTEQLEMYLDKDELNKLLYACFRKL